MYEQRLRYCQTPSVYQHRHNSLRKGGKEKKKQKKNNKGLKLPKFDEKY